MYLFISIYINYVLLVSVLIYIVLLKSLLKSLFTHFVTNGKKQCYTCYCDMVTCIKSYILSSVFS